MERLGRIQGRGCWGVYSNKNKFVLEAVQSEKGFSVHYDPRY